MSGFENIDNLLRITIGLVGLSITVGGLIIRYLYKINKTTDDVRSDFTTFKSELREEMTTIKFRIEHMSDKLKDSYSKQESDNRLLQLEMKITDKIAAACNTMFQKLSNIGGKSKKEGE